MVKETLRSLGNGILKAQNTILSAAAILGVASGVSAFLGFIKGRLLASFFGIDAALSVFYTADKIPNLIYSVLVLGALSTVFIPVFSEVLYKDRDKAWKTASSVIIVSMLVFFVVGALIFIFAPQVIHALSLGKFSRDEVFLGADLMRIMLAAQLVLILGSFATSILHVFKYFLIPALAPIVYNVGMILGIVFLSKSMGIYGPTVGVAIGALLHLVIQLPLLRHTGFHFSFALNFRDSGLMRLLSLIPARIASVLMSSVVSTVNNSLAILVSTSSVVFLRFANQLQFFPVNLFGVSLASALLPSLSDTHARGDKEAFKKLFVTSLHQMFFLSIPVSVILLVLRVPVVRIVYGVSRFPWEATVKTSYALAFFSFSIFSQGAIYLLTRAFYALKDTVTPVKVSSVTTIIDILLALFFVVHLNLGVWSIALAFSLVMLLDMAILLLMLSTRLGGFDPRVLFVPFVKISYAAVFMGLCLYIPLKLLDQYVFDTTRTLGLLFLTGSATLFGGMAYLFFTELFNVGEVQMLYRFLGKINILKSRLSVLDSEKVPVLE